MVFCMFTYVVEPISNLHFRFKQMGGDNGPSVDHRVVGFHCNKEQIKNQWKENDEIYLHRSPDSQSVVVHSLHYLSHISAPFLTPTQISIFSSITWYTGGEIT